MTKEEVLNLKNAVIEGESTGYFSISVFYVASACFNDEMLVDEFNIPLEEIKDKPIFYFDPFMGHEKDSTMRIAIAAYVDKRYSIIVDENGEKTVTDSYIFTASGKGKDHFYACHIHKFH